MNGVWSLTAKGIKHMESIMRVMKAKPSLLTQMLGAHDVDVREGLRVGATWGQRLHSLFSLGCTPLGTLIDVSQLKPAQQVTLWHAVVALCNARPGDVESAQRLA